MQNETKLLRTNIQLILEKKLITYSSFSSDLALSRKKTIDCQFLDQNTDNKLISKLRKFCLGLAEKTDFGFVQSVLELAEVYFIGALIPLSSFIVNSGNFC